MTVMKQTPLEQLATVSAGQSAPKDNEFSEAGTPFVRAGSLDGLLSGRKESELELVSDATAKLRKLRLYPKGTILFAKSGMSATKGRVYVLQSEAYVVSHLATLIPHADVSAEYLRLALKAFPPSVLIRDPAYPAISLGDIGRYAIPVPDVLDDQVRIAQVLSKVEGLITERKQHIRLLDDLLKSVFLEMFGYRDGTYDKWPSDKLFLHASIVSGVTKGKRYGSEELVEVPYMRVANVQDGHFVLDEVKTIAVSKKEMNQYRLQTGDLLLTEGGDPDKLGRGAVWQDQVPGCIHQNHIFRVRVNNERELNPHYLSALVGSRYGKSYFLKCAKQTTGIASINSTQLKNFPTPIPPIELQEDFADIVEQVERLRPRYRKSLEDLELLYGAIAQLAFKGELDLSRVPFPNAAPLEPQPPMLIDRTPPPLQAITLPDSELLSAALNNRDRAKDLLQFWLGSYCAQLEGAPFSAQAFMTAAQTRIADLHPDADFELDTRDYEHIKSWVFSALDDGALTQGYANAENRVALANATKSG